MKTGRIAILSASHLCRNPRVVKEATSLGAAGHDVTVLTVSSHERFERMDQELMRGRPFQRKVVDHTADTLAARARGFIQRGSTWGARLLCRSLRFETAAALGPASALLRLARAEPADLFICHTEIPTWAARYLIRDGRRVAVDVEDWYSQDLLFADRANRPLRLLERAERFALQHAAYVSTTSDSMAEALAEAYGGPRPLTLRNTFPLQERHRLDRPPAVGAPSFIWFSQTIGPGRGLELFLAAWSRMRHRSQVCLLGDERPGYREQLLARVPAERRGDVRFLALVTPDELPNLLAEHDIGLALEPHWPRNRDLTISNKIFQYLNAGLAVVATDTLGQAEVMRAAPNVGLLIAGHETTQVTAQLDELVGDPARLRSTQAHARGAAQTAFAWEHDAPRLLAAVERALGGT
ncbi:MAG TPA: glycosyltransferase [Opitutaceae bacterium]|nr:glycosyltransferase [Opitutaceae bacterium]